MVMGPTPPGHWRDSAGDGRWRSLKINIAHELCFAFALFWRINTIDADIDDSGGRVLSNRL